MYKLFQKKSIIAVATIFVYLSQPVNVEAIAQVSKPIVIDDAVAGQRYDEVITLYNTDQKKVRFSLRAIGGIAQWTEFYADESKKEKIDSIEIDASSSIKAIASFVLPADVPVATYEGSLVFGYAPAADTEITADQTMQVLAAIGRKVSITTGGTPVKQCDCQYISMGNNVLKTGQYEVSVMCTNTGNVAIKPQVAQKIYNDGAVFLDVAHSYNGVDGGILPGRTMTLPIKYAVSGLALGKYKSEFQAKIDDVLMDGYILEFNVVEASPFAMASLWITASQILQKHLTVVVVVILVLILGIAFFARKISLAKRVL